MYDIQGKDTSTQDP